MLTRHGKRRRVERVLGAAVLVSAACTGATGPPAPRATVQVQPGTVSAVQFAAGPVTWVRFTVPVTVRNDGSAPVAYDGCASVVEQRAGSGWRVAWAPICAASGGTRPTIAPGATLALAVAIEAALAGPGAPKWEGSGVEGEHRFRAALLSETTRGSPIPTVSSNPFAVALGQ